MSSRALTLPALPHHLRNHRLLLPPVDAAQQAQVTLRQVQSVGTEAQPEPEGKDRRGSSKALLSARLRVGQHV